MVRKMLSEIDYIRIFCEVDDFCKGFEGWYVKELISDGMVKRKRSLQMKLSEIITIMISYHASGMACFKHYYYYLKTERKDLFLNMVHYDSFIRYVKKAFSCLICMFKAIEGGITEYMFIDATPMAVCHNLREKRHKVFKDIAKKGKTSTGWFFGFKLHMLFNTHGEVVRLAITPGNTDDRAPVPDMLKDISCKLIGDKGYLSKKLFNTLFEQGTTLITKIKKNMKNCLMHVKDKLMLQKRSLVETIFSSMKSLRTLIHPRHRSPINAFSHILAGLINYQLRPDKPVIDKNLFIIS